jgi:hypothetical protein
MKSSKLKNLIEKVESSSDETNEDFKSLSDELAIKIAGGVEYTNTQCTNQSCTGGSSYQCTNSSCTSGTSNFQCTNQV